MKIHNLIFEEKDRLRFNEIKNGRKKIETRANDERYISIKSGDQILFTCGKEYFTKKVNKVYHWPNFEEMIAEVPLDIVMPGLCTVKQAESRYSKYPGYIERIEKGGILGFELI